MLFVIIGVAIIILIAGVVYVRSIKGCEMCTLCHAQSTEDVENQETTKYDMTPSEVHEYKDFAKAMAGEIYVEKTVRRNSPTGMEKFRRIPSLASDKNKRKSRHISNPSPPPQDISCNLNNEEDKQYQQSVESSLSVEDKDDVEDDSVFGGETSCLSNNKTIHSKLSAESFDDDSPLGRITAKSVKAFTNKNRESPKDVYLDVENFLIANDEAAI